MALSQCLDDLSLSLGSKQSGGDDLNLQEVYNETHRLALEELLSGGVDNFLDFIRKERIPSFLSDDEIQRIRSAAKAPRSESVHGEDQSLEQSQDCSSLSYFPEVSDVEPPLLEMGWPAFTAGSYRGVTRAVAHFQPSYGESIYSCKEAVRRMIKSAKEVIAIVTDSLTDLDIFKDLQEACSSRKVPVYILLDKSGAPAFLKMCRNVGVFLDVLRQMRVRTITGMTYYTRSGARVTGEAHERFMLIDGTKVATGSYRFNWTDGKLNSSNLIELSGQITEKFDQEFRILYAESLPINTQGPPSVRNSGIFEQLLIKHPVTSSPHLSRERQVCLTSTPSRNPHTLVGQPPCEPSTAEVGLKANPASDSSTIGEDLAEQQQHMQEEILAGTTALHFLAHKVAERELMTPSTMPCHVTTQTSWSVADRDVQTDLQLTQQPKLITTTQNQNQSQATSSSTAYPKQTSHTQAAPDNTLKDYFDKLTKERERYYSAIRFKLEHMVTSLSQRGELADVTNKIQWPGAYSGQRIQKRLWAGTEPQPAC